MSDTLVLTVRVVVSLALVLGLLWFLARRLGAGKGPSRRLPITVLGRQSLGRRSGVTVVDIAGRTLVLGVSDTEVRLLTELESGPFRLEEMEPETADGAAATPAPLAVTPRATRPSSPLSGSVLAPDTWRSSWQALRDGFKR